MKRCPPASTVGCPRSRRAVRALGSGVIEPQGDAVAAFGVPAEHGFAEPGWRRIPEATHEGAIVLLVREPEPRATHRRTARDSVAAIGSVEEQRDRSAQARLFEASKVAVGRLRHET